MAIKKVRSTIKTSVSVMLGILAILIITYPLILSTSNLTGIIPESSSNRSLLSEYVYDIRNTKILFAIPSYDNSKFDHLETMIDNIRNVCEAGAAVTLMVYTSEPYSVETIHVLNSRIRCRHSTGKLNMQVKINAPSLKSQFVDFHRKDFYDNIESYDLFIYSEDNIGIQTRHIVSYLDETERLRRTVGINDFSKYSIGFIRYEISPDHRRVTFDQFLFENAALKPFTVPPLKGRYLYNTILPYQGMYMATREQLQLWKLNCTFHMDIVEEGNQFHREYVANLRLYENIRFPNDNCKVKQVLPLDTFNDFMLHHLDDTLFSTLQEQFPDPITKNTMDPLRFQKFREGLITNKELKMYVGADGLYSGIVTGFGVGSWKDGEAKPNLSLHKWYESTGGQLPKGLLNNGD